MKKFVLSILAIFLLFLIVPNVNATKHYILFAYDGTIGGTEGKLDNVDLCNADGSGYDVQDKDAALVWDQSTNKFSFYIMDIDSGATELDPFVIAPDDCDGSPYAGNARWIATGVLDKISINDSDGETITDAQARRGIIVYESGNQQTIVLPAVADEMFVCVFATGADASAEIYLDPNGSDHIDHKGTSAAAGEYMHNTSNEKDDYYCVIGEGSNTWKEWGSRGTWAEQTP